MIIGKSPPCLRRSACPPHEALGGGASRRQVPPLFQRGVLPPLGKACLREALRRRQGRLGGILQIDAVTILRLLIRS